MPACLPLNNACQALTGLATERGNDCLSSNLSQQVALCLVSRYVTKAIYNYNKDISLRLVVDKFNAFKLVGLGS